MKRMGLMIAVVAAFALLAPADSSARKGMDMKGSGGWGTGSPYHRLYDPKTVETVSGEVASVEKVKPHKGMSYGIHLQLKTADEMLSVHLGPGWFIENQDVGIGSGDKVEVKGSRIAFEGKPAIIAAEVKRGNDVLKLRDENGVPVWSGWRRK